MHRAAAAVAMGTYSPWESTASLRSGSAARGASAPTEGGEGRALPHSLLLAITVGALFICRAIQLVKHGLLSPRRAVVWSHHAGFPTQFWGYRTDQKHRVDYDTIAGPVLSHFERQICPIGGRNDLCILCDVSLDRMARMRTLLAMNNTASSCVIVWHEWLQQCLTPYWPEFESHCRSFHWLTSCVCVCVIGQVHGSRI